MEIFSLKWTDALLAIPRSLPPGSPSGLHLLIASSTPIHLQISFLPVQKHLQAHAIPLRLWQRPSSMPSSPFVWITATESCPGFPAKPWTGSSVCRSNLPAFSAAPSPGSTSPHPRPPSLSPGHPTISSSSPTNPFMPLPQNTYQISFNPHSLPGFFGYQTRACSHPHPHNNLLTFN